jgi:hypothetical protein
MLQGKHRKSAMVRSFVYRGIHNPPGFPTSAEKHRKSAMLRSFMYRGIHNPPGFPTSAEKKPGWSR